MFRLDLFKNECQLISTYLKPNNLKVLKSAVMIETFELKNFKKWQ